MDLSGGADHTRPIVPAGPKGLPLLGNILELAKDPIKFLTDCDEKFGPIVDLNLAGWRTLAVTDQAFIERVLVKEHTKFIKNSRFFRHVTTLFGKGLLLNEGESWRKQRLLIAPVFSNKELASHWSDVTRFTKEKIAKIDEGEPLDAKAVSSTLTLRIAAKAFFDCEVDSEIKTIGEAVFDLTTEIRTRYRRPFVIPDRIPLPSNRRYLAAIGKLETVLLRMFEKRRSEGFRGRDDFLSRMMAENEQNGNQMTDELLRDEAMTMLLVGHETVALALTWALYLLAQNPGEQEKVRAAVINAIGDRELTVNDLNNLDCLEGVILESMRLYPPIWLIGRESVESFEVGGKRFDAGTTVLFSPWMIHRKRELYEEPNAFRPERWSTGLHRTLPRFGYIPFGGGPRVCIGKAFAITELKLILGTLLQHYSFEYAADRPPEPFLSITYRPADTVMMIARKL